MPNLVAWMTAALALALAPSTHAEVYRCTAKSGLPLYQNFPCELDSLGLPGPASTRMPAPPPKSIQDLKAPAPTEPRVGMTADEVKKIWGEPPDVLQDEPRSGRVEIWQYADGRVVQLDHKHRVIAVQR